MTTDIPARRRRCRYAGPRRRRRPLLRLEEGHATTIIAHSISTICRTRRIHVLEGGRLVEPGTHHQPTEAGGTPADRWRRHRGETISHP